MEQILTLKNGIYNIYFLNDGELIGTQFNVEKNKKYKNFLATNKDNAVDLDEFLLTLESTTETTEEEVTEEIVEEETTEETEEEVIADE